MTTDLGTARPPRTGPPSVPSAARRSGWSLPEVRWACAATALFALGGIAQLAGAPAWLWWTLYLACYAAGGWEPGWSGLRALRERTLDVDLLMVVAAIGAAAIGQVFDGALLIVIFATSGALEAVATKRTEDSVRGLLELAPERATRLTGDGEEVVTPERLEIGDVILVRPGERIGADGQVVSGLGEVDQASVTGEGLPVPKGPGDEVFAGTLNGTGALRVRVTRSASDTVIARIVAMVERASATKARTQLFIEKVEQRYSVVMVAATLALFAVPLLWGTPVQESLLRAMTFMIVASPCAVVLATMPPLLAAIATAGRHGVLVKSAVVMERLGTVDRVAFDKTGTLTEGHPRLAALHPLPGTTPATTDPAGDHLPTAGPAGDRSPTAGPAGGPLSGRPFGAGLDRDRLLALAAAAERDSQHPLGRAVVRAAQDAGLAIPPAEDFTSIPGQGVRARVDGHLIEIGSPSRFGTTLPEVGPGGPARLGEAPPEGVPGDPDRLGTDLPGSRPGGVVLLVDGVPAAVLTFSDLVRQEAPDAVARLETLTGARPVLLTGDDQAAARAVAGRVGITDVRAGLLPEDKVHAVQELQAAGHRAALVGDGVNDAPAMAAAHIGIAMGGTGSDLALDTADAVITRDDLAAVPAVIALARRARRLVVANLVIAATFIGVLVAWDLFGDLPLPLGVAGHEGSTVIVGLNGLRLLRDAAWRRAAKPSEARK